MKKIKQMFRVNWGNGQVQTVTSKTAGLNLIKGDLYAQFASVQAFDGHQWITIAKGA